MSDVRPDSPLRPAKLPPKPPAGNDRPPQDPPKQQVSSDRLRLSPEARAASSKAVEAEVSNQDVTVATRLNDRATITGRYVYDSETMMQGAGLVKLDYQLGQSTTAFVGAGHMPGFYRHSVGPNLRQDAPHSAVFFGVEDLRGTSRDLGNGLRLDLGLSSVAVGTLAYNHEIKGLDMNSSAGLSKATVTGEATLSKQFGNLEASVGYGNHLDLGMIGNYYAGGGSGLFPQTHYLQAGLGGRAGALDFRADAYVPLATATNDFSRDPKLRAQVAGPYMPTLAAVASPRGLEQIEASKSWAINREWDATASASVVRPFDRPQYAAQVGLRYTFGGRDTDSPRRATRPSPDYRAEAPRPRENKAARVAQPKLKEYFSPAEIRAMKGKSVEELAGILKTPEQVVAYLDEFVTYDYDRLKDPKGDYGSMTPNEVATLLKGVCRDQHPFIVSVMKEGQGVNGKTIGYAAPDTAHAIAVYQDPGSGKWNVIEYGRIHYTQSDSAEEAFDRIRPDALVSGEWSENGPNGKNYQKSIRYSETAREFYRFVQPSKN